MSMPRAVAALLLPLAIGCDARQPANRYVEPPPPPVTVAAPAHETVQQAKDWTARIVADVVDVRTRVTGYLQAIRFKDGQDVAAGDLLFEIDPAPFEAARDRALAEVAAAEARVQLAAAEGARYRELLDMDGVSQSEADIKFAQHEVAKATKSQADAALRAAEIDLSYCRITAPIAGKIGESRFTVGALVNAIEASHLVTIVQQSPIYAYFNASEAEFLEYQRDKREGRTEAAADGRTRVELGLRDDPGHSFAGLLDFAEPQLDLATGTMKLRAAFENADGALVSGLFARIRIPGPTRDALLVPESVIQIDQAGRFVLVVNADQIVERRDVVLAEAVGANRVVAKGLTGDERVIVNGLARARTGARVQIMPTAAN